MSHARLPMCHGKLPRSREFIERGADAALALAVEHCIQGPLAAALAAPGAGLALLLQEAGDRALLLAIMASQDALGRSYPWLLAERWPWPGNAHQSLRLAYRLACLAGALPASAAALDAEALDAQRARLAVRDAELEQDRAWHALAGHPVRDAPALWGQWRCLRGWPEQGRAARLQHPAEVLAAAAAAFHSSHGAAPLAWTVDAAGTQHLALAASEVELAALLTGLCPPPLNAAAGLRLGDLQQHLQRFLVTGNTAPSVAPSAAGSAPGSAKAIGV